MFQNKHSQKELETNLLEDLQQYLVLHLPA